MYFAIAEVDWKYSGITAVLQPNPVLQINIGATNQTQGQYAYTISGIVPDDVYAASDQLMTKLREFKGFATVRSDFYNSTPNLTVDIDRERAATYGGLDLRRAKFVANGLLTKLRLFNQEAGRSVSGDSGSKDNERTNPGDLDNLYVRGSGSPATGAFGPSGGITTTTGTARNLVPLRAVTSSNIVVGPQAVNHFNQFTSVTINFNLLPASR